MTKPVRYLLTATCLEILPDSAGRPARNLCHTRHKHMTTANPDNTREGAERLARDFSHDLAKARLRWDNAAKVWLACDTLTPVAVTVTTIKATRGRTKLTSRKGLFRKGAKVTTGGASLNGAHDPHWTVATRSACYGWQRHALEHENKSNRDLILYAAALGAKRGTLPANCSNHHAAVHRMANGLAEVTFTTRSNDKPIAGAVMVALRWLDWCPDEPVDESDAPAIAPAMEDSAMVLA